ncbi:hypothetical protein [Streptomyces rubiginosohelvolus]|uniref:hypothetical protein n=1 Tax=Streptomyces rubiginosohelvolus TaxID=67362 RepID=UPI0033C2FA9B
MATHILTPATARLALISCALRNKGAGWELINDAAHEPSGVTAVVQHPTHLEIKHPVGAVKVLWMQVTVDEYYASTGLRCGPSAGLAFSRIELYSGPSTTPINPATLVASYGNLWVSGVLVLPPA